MRVRRKRFKKYTMILLSEFLMRRVGIEPTTFGLEDQCSIQLSYRPRLFQYIINLPIVKLKNGNF